MQFDRQQQATGGSSVNPGGTHGAQSGAVGPYGDPSNPPLQVPAIGFSAEKRRKTGSWAPKTGKKDWSEAAQSNPKGCHTPYPAVGTADQGQCASSDKGQADATFGAMEDPGRGLLRGRHGPPTPYRAL